MPLILRRGEARFDFGSQPSMNEPLVRELMGGEFIDTREHVLFIGNCGTGKTHLACALAFSACMQGRRVRFSTVTGLVAELLECREDQTLGRLHEQLEREHLSVLDELGYVPFFKTGSELLGSELLTGALLDRVTHRVHIIETNGGRYSLRQAKKRARRQSQKR